MKGLGLSHLDGLILYPECQLIDSPLRNIRHICNVTITTWGAPVDFIVMRTLLKILPSATVELEGCRILPCKEKKMTLDNSPEEMVNIVRGLCFPDHICSYIANVIRVFCMH